MDAVTLGHNLNPFFDEMAGFQSTKDLKRSEVYQKIGVDLETVLNGYEADRFAPSASEKPFYRAVCWNIERGIEFEGILHTLECHPLLKEGDVFLLPETDMGMIRSANRNVARELAERLKLNYYFVPTYLNFSKGNGTEIHFEGDNTLGIHGNAVLSRYPLSDFKRVPLHNNKDKMRGKEKRLGSQQALICTAAFPQGDVRIVCAHLDAHSSKRHRKDQMAKIMAALKELEPLPTLFGGDLNTTTYNSRTAFWAIFGFWVRVSMGVRYVIAKHYPYPDRLFERGLFKQLTRHGFDYKNWNEPGGCTLHYHVEDLRKIKNLKDLIPAWCFKFIDWACAKNNGRCSFKIDWFAAKDLNLASTNGAFPGSKSSPLPPHVVGSLVHEGRPCSDHDAILVDFEIPKK